MTKVWGLDKTPVVTSTGWFNTLYSDFMVNEYEKWHEVFNTPRVRASDTEETYRTLNYWDEQGLLLSGRKNTDTWRQFSVLDVVWIKILKAAKQYGMKNEQLLRLKEDLGFIHDERGYTEFEFWMWVALAGKECVVIVVPDGRGSIATPQDVEITHKLFGLGESFLTINFKQIVFSVLKGDADTKGRKKAPLVDLHDKEYELVMKLRDNEIDEATAFKRNGKIERLEWKAIQKNPEMLLPWLSEQMKKEGNQTFTVKMQDEKILFVERKVSKK